MEAKIDIQTGRAGPSRAPPNQTGAVSAPARLTCLRFGGPFSPPLLVGFGTVLLLAEEHIDTEHLLLGILRHDKELIRQVLPKADFKSVRRDIANSAKPASTEGICVRERTRQLRRNSGVTAQESRGAATPNRYSVLRKSAAGA